MKGYATDVLASDSRIAAVENFMVDIALIERAIDLHHKNLVSDLDRRVLYIPVHDVPPLVARAPLTSGSDLDRVCINDRHLIGGGSRKANSMVNMPSTSLRRTGLQMNGIHSPKPALSRQKYRIRPGQSHRSTLMTSMRREGHG